MKLVIAAVNAKYVHTSLSVRCLHAAVKDYCACSYSEYTINDLTDSIASDLYEQKPDAVACSCYIWNIECILKVSQMLKLANPNIKIILGGYEVMYDAKNVLNDNLLTSTPLFPLEASSVPSIYTHMPVQKPHKK